MPSNKIGALNVELSLVSDNFISGLKDAQKEADATVKAYKPLTTAFKEAGEAMAVFGDVIAGTLVEASVKAAEYGAQLQHLSEKSGASVEDLSKLGFAAEQNGSSIDALGTSLKFLSKNMELASEDSKAQVQAFANLGITQKDLQTTGGSSSAMFALLADRISGMSDPTQYAADLTKVLGKNWTEILPTLKLGSEGLKDTGDQASYLGRVISGETAEADLKFEQSMKQVTAAVGGLETAIGNALLPVLKPLVDDLTEGAVAAKNFANEHQGVTVALLDVAGAVGGLGTAMTAIGFAWPTVYKSFMAGFDLIEGAIGTYSATALTATEVGGLMGESIVDIGYETTKASGILGLFEGGLAGVAGVLTGPVGVTVAIAAGTAAIIYMLEQTDDGRKIISDITDGFKDWIVQIKDASVELLHFSEAIGSLLKSGLVAFVGDVASAFVDVTSGVKSATAATKDYLGINTKDVWDTLRTSAEIESGAFGTVASIIKAATAALHGFVVEQDEKAIRDAQTDSYNVKIRGSVDDVTKALNLQAIAGMDAGTANAASAAGTAAALAAAAKKIREDQSKANDEYYAAQATAAEHLRSLGLISNDDLVTDLLDYENKRFASEDHADGNVEALTQKHYNNLQAIQFKGEDAARKMALDQQKQTESDIKQSVADQLNAQLLVLSGTDTFNKKMFDLGVESADQLRDNELATQQERYQDQINANGDTEAIEQDNKNKLQQIQLNYAANVLKIDQTLSEGEIFFAQTTADMNAGIRTDQNSKAKIDGDEALKVQKANAKEQGALGTQIQKEWSSAMNKMAGDIAGSLADMVISWQFNADALVKIAKDTADSMLKALIKGLITPFTDALAQLGANITKTLLAAGGIGSAPAGGILGGTGILGGLLGGTDKGGIPGVDGAPGKDLGQTGGLLGSTTGLATLGIGAAIGAVTAWVKSQAHWEANDLVQNFQNPFDQKFAGIISMITGPLNAGTLSLADALDADTAMHNLVSTTNTAVDNWAVGSKDKEKVAGQYHATEDPQSAGWLNWIDSIVGGLGGKVPSFAVGIDNVPHDMLAMIHKGEAVVPAAANKVIGGGWTGGNQQASNVTNLTLNIDASGAGDNMESLFTTKIIPLIKRAMGHDTQGLKTNIALNVKRAFPGLAAT